MVIWYLFSSGLYLGMDLSDRVKLVFIDDNIKNIEVAKSLGFICIHIKEDTDLEKELRDLGIEF